MSLDEQTQNEQVPRSRFEAEIEGMNVSREAEYASQTLCHPYRLSSNRDRSPRHVPVQVSAAETQTTPSDASSSCKRRIKNLKSGRRVESAMTRRATISRRINLTKEVVGESVTGDQACSEARRVV